MWHWMMMNLQSNTTALGIESCNTCTYPSCNEESNRHSRVDVSSADISNGPNNTCNTEGKGQGNLQGKKTSNLIYKVD